MKVTKQTVGKYLIEFLIVAFGVFLGLFVNEWNVGKTKNENSKRTLHLIIEEIDNNIVQLQYAISYHEQLSKNIDSVLSKLTEEDRSIGYYRNRKFRYNTLPVWRGLGFANLESIVYESSKLNGVLQEFNISTTKEISRAYIFQENYLKNGARLEERLFLVNSTTKVVDVISIFERVKYDIYANETWLLGELEKTKKVLEETNRSNDYK